MGQPLTHKETRYILPPLPRLLIILYHYLILNRVSLHAPLRGFESRVISLIEVVSSGGAEETRRKGVIFLCGFWNSIKSI